MRHLPLLVAGLLASCGQSSTLTIEVLHPTTFMPQNADGNLTLSILAADGKAVSTATVALKNLSRQHLLDGLSLAAGKPYVLRLVADNLKGSTCKGARAVGETTFTYQAGAVTQRVYFDCADASSPATSLLTSRMYHSATYLPKLSQVVIAGGAKVDSLPDVLNATAYTTLESYSLADGKAYQLNGTLDPGRLWHQAVAVGEEEVVSLGGLERKSTGLASMTQVARLGQPKPTTGEVQVQGAEAMLRARSLHAVVPLKESQLLVVGGALSVVAGLAYLQVPAAAVAEIYDAKAGKRVSSAAVAGTSARVNPAAASFGPNRALVAGGGADKQSPTQIDIFCGDAGNGCACTPPCFTPGPSLPGERLGLTATYVPCPDGGSGAVYLVGGQEKATPKDIQHAEIYCVSTKAPTTLAPYGNLLTARSGHTATLVRGSQGQRLLVAGGTTTVFPDPTAELVPVTCDCSKAKGSIVQVTLQTKRSGHSATLLPDGTVLLAGGYSEQSVERFNPDL